jgi:uncharacterized protein YjbJ (UPF0337 family)
MAICNGQQAKGNKQKATSKRQQAIGKIKRFYKLQTNHFK